MSGIPSWLDSGCMARILATECEDYICRGGCAEMVKQAPSGRWYITMGHAGFNSRANNGAGYASEGKARAALGRYLHA